MKTHFDASDRRAVEGLTALLCNTDAEPADREGASRALLDLDGSVEDPSDAQLYAWWNSGDALLRRHAMSLMSGLQLRELVEQTAADPAHPLRACAMNHMAFWFEHPAHQAIKVDGLRSRDAEVRLAAADALVYDEPLIAEQPLIEALADEDPRVVEAALDALEYYPSQRVYLALLAHRAEATVDALRSTCLREATERDEARCRHVQSWLAPIAPLLAFTDEELQPPKPSASPPRPHSPKTVRTTHELIEALLDADATTPVAREPAYRNGLGGGAHEAA